MKQRIVSDPAILSGTPVFCGTRIPLDHVVGVIRKGASEADLAEDFPSLSKDDIEYARAQAIVAAEPQARPKPLQVRRITKAA